MTRRINFFFLAAGLSALLGSPIVNAQTNSEVAQIPFAFYANSTKLPAGEYTVERNSSSGITRIHDETGRGIFLTTAGETTSKMDNPRLTFACYGGECILSQIWMPDAMGYNVTQPRQRELTRKLGVAAEMRSVRLSSH